MIFSTPQTEEFTAKSDPSEPKTLWRVQPLGYRAKLEVQKLTGKAPLEALHVFSAAYPPGPPDETDEERKKRFKILHEKAALLPETDRRLIETAQEYLTMYNFAVCVCGVVGVDGTIRTRPEVEHLLDTMAPADEAANVISEIASKIMSLTKATEEKKTPSA